MKYFKVIFAAVLALFLTACSFFSKTNEYSSSEEDGSYFTINCPVELTGGSGKASVESPALVEDYGDTKNVMLVWSSPNYDYMLVDGSRYENEAADGANSVFTIPFSDYDKEFKVIADTTAMSTPHEIEYGLTVYSVDTPELSSSEDASVEAVDYSYELGDLTYVDRLELEYAKGFAVEYYTDNDNNEYTFISINAAGTAGQKQYFLLAPKGVNTDISDNVTAINKVDKTYLVSTSVMDYIAHIDALDSIAFSGTKSSDWDVDKAKEAMENGNILYAGKYSAPDYELLLEGDCNLAIENTMIYHNPEAKEKLEELDIPVLVETSSYESSPLGRLEWVKLYGAIYGKADEAEALFNEQKARVDAVAAEETTDKTVAFFSINSNGQITVRKSNDYIASMIKMAGGSYVPEELYDSENALSTLKITAEDFYLYASDADILIYNSTIEGEIDSVAELIKKLQALGDFKAVKDNNVYCLKEGYFQKSTSVAEFIEELHNILTDSYKEGECFYKLKE
ncbi:MAG: ABC transporter substrate-binding protein [Pseudobutyrivibrio sp.]|nr:ABC transporter substrate-binding protein [Pseudobutyrivibrio sp.]